MVLAARAAGYRLIGTCVIPNIETLDEPYNGVQVFLERPVPPSTTPKLPSQG